MKFVVVGLDDAGRSTLLQGAATQLVAERDFVFDRLWDTNELPPLVSVPRRRPDEEFVQLTSTASGSAFSYVPLPPGFEFSMHRSDTLDYGVVIAGEVFLIVETGEIELTAGDCYVMPGLLHRWRAGPRGTTLCVVNLGLGPL
jgi:quercetin dioxygenase-like cupin family protein